MVQVIKLLLYYFLSQLCVTALAIAGYFCFFYLKFNSFPGQLGLPLNLSLAANIVSILFMVWLILSKKYLTINKEALNPGKGSDIIIYSMIGITAMIWMNFLSDLLSLPDWFESTFKMMQDNIVGVLTMAIIAPIFEEMFFRGAIEGYLLRKWKNPRYAILVSALIFGIVHINPIQVLFAFLFGLILGEIYFRTKSLTAVIILHFINNAASVALMILYPEDETLTQLLGFDNMAILSSISLIAFVLLLRAFINRYPKKYI